MRSDDGLTFLAQANYLQTLPIESASPLASASRFGRFCTSAAARLFYVASSNDDDPSVAGLRLRVSVSTTLSTLATSSLELPDSEICRSRDESLNWSVWFSRINSCSEPAEASAARAKDEHLELRAQSLGDLGSIARRVT